MHALHGRTRLALPLILPLVLALAAGATHAQFQAQRLVAQPHPLDESVLYAATRPDLHDAGALVAVGDVTPWTVEPLAATDGGQSVRVFGPLVFVLNRWTGTVTLVRPGSGEPPTVWQLDPLCEPVDVLVLGDTAWVARHRDSRLLCIDLPTGAQSEGLDLAALALPGESTLLGTLVRDGTRVFVQVTLTESSPPGQREGREGREARSFPDRGVLGVIDVGSESLIDVQPLVPGLQGVALDGAPPHLKMQILDEARRLYVSTTGSTLDDRGGIEIVDLVALRSIGYALSESQIADLGGFVMTSTAGGYFVFHTDIVASTHLKPFTIAGGPDADSEMIVLFGVIDALAYDAQRHRIYLPSGFDGAHGLGLHAFDTRSNQPLPGSPFSTGAPPHDVVLVGD